MNGFSTFVLPQPNDVSVTYLTSILGQPIMNGLFGSAVPGGPTIFSDMMSSFNHILLGGGLLIFAILLFVGTMNTAADGQFLGRNWHSVWTPMRLIFGVLLVVPLNTGYCIGQYIILYAIMIGIHFATSVWQNTINDVFNNQIPPPVPAYLTANVQQIVGVALSNIAVPTILQSTGLAGSGGSGGIVTLPVQDSYVVGSSSIPSGMVSAIVNNAILNGTDAYGNPTGGVCNLLYTGLLQNCGGAVSNALNGSQVGQLVPFNGAYFMVNIGTNTPSPALSASSFSASTNTLPATPTALWNGGGSGSGPNGTILVYGDVVYNPAATPGGNGTIVTDLQSIIQNGVMTPANAVTSSPNNGQGSGGNNTQATPWQNLLGWCQTTLPDPLYPSNAPPPVPQISPCSLQDVVQQIMVTAQADAQTFAYQAAGGINGQGANGQTYSKNASAPPPTGDDPFDVPPDSQAAALANNMYQCKDASGNPSVCYNLNDYWIPNINSQGYIDLQLNNSWWVAGSSYLVLDNAMGQNLAWMAQSIQQQLAAFQSASGSVNPNLVYNCGTGPGQNNGFSPDLNPKDLTGFLNSELCLSYSIQVLEASTNLQQSGGSFTSPAPLNNYSTCEPYYVGWMPSVGSASATDDYYYSCAGDMARASAPLAMVVQYQQPNVAVANWNSLIAPYNPNATVGGAAPVPGQVPASILSANPSFYAQLVAMPGALQMPFAVMLTVAQTAQNALPSGSNINYYQNLFPYLSALIDLLQYNQLMSGNQIQAALPVNNAINNIFTQLVGGTNGGPGNAGEAQAAGAAINTVMQQVYNLGVVNNSQGAVASQFSLIQQAQVAGISMIMACVTSMQTIYDTYTAQLQGMINQVNQSTSQAAAQASNLTIAGAAIPFLGPLMGALANAQIQQTQLAVMTTTVTTLTNISIQLMWLPLLIFILTSLFTAGVQFAILVPLMPYILFWAGQIAWLIGVLEAIVAAPLVMLGLAHPGGHEFMGHTVPAVRMLLGVVFRPVLMIIGLVIGILLTYVVIYFSAQGFHTVAAGILNAVPSSENTAQGIMACLMLFIYATFLVMAFQKCFSTIYVIPERVVEWIGGSAARAGPEELQQISGATQQMAGSAAQAGGQSLQQGLQAQQQRGQQMSDLAQKGMMTKYETTKGYAEAAQKTQQMGMEAVELMM